MDINATMEMHSALEKEPGCLILLLSRGLCWLGLWLSSRLF